MYLYVFNMASPHNIMQDLGTNCASFIQLSLSHPLFIDLLPIALHCVLVNGLMISYHIPILLSMLDCYVIVTSGFQTKA